MATVDIFRSWLDAMIDLKHPLAVMYRRFGVRTHFDELGHAICTTPGHAVQHQAVQRSVEVGGRAEALDQCEGATVGFDK
jgi:hypothetical protein